jgi:hypothetical protein
VKALVADLVTAIFILAVIYVLARPQSKAADAVDAFFGAVASMVAAATDL